MEDGKLSPKDRRLMKKYGFIPRNVDENTYNPPESKVFAYRTFMEMKGNLLEKDEEKKGKSFIYTSVQ